MTRKGLEGGSFRVLTEDSILKVHQTAMQVIEEVGFEVQSEMALELFEGAGAEVDWEKHLAAGWKRLRSLLKRHHRKLDSAARMKQMILF